MMKYHYLGRAGFGLACACVIALSALAGSKPPPPADLTKPNNFDTTTKSWLFTVGPTGIIGVYVGGPKYGNLRGQQIFIRQVAEGSPAHGKVEVGDLIIGVNGKLFSATKGSMIVNIGNAIDEAEKHENKGKIKFTIWHDENFKHRTSLGELDIRGMDIGKYIAETEATGSGVLDRYKTQEQIKQEVKDTWKEAYVKFPIVASVKEVELTLETMGTYSDTSPWDCPKIKKIREQAYPHLERAALGRGGVSGFRRGTTGLALLASGKPEHVELVKKVVHKNKKLMAAAPVGNDGWGWHYGSWYCGYSLSFLGEYYLRTGDKDILPALREWALGSARLQTYGGAWGHSQAPRSMNFGQLGGPPPGYGEMNQAGGPNFYGLALTVKAGVKDPMIVEALRKAVRYNSQAVDRGTMHYGFHYPAGYEDSNGKNGPPGLGMYVVGEYYKAKYYALSCAVASSWGYRGGHGDGTFGNYWPQLSSCRAGKDVVITWMKKARPYYTMARKWDGSFVSVSGGNNLGIGCLFNPTAMYMLHFSIPMAKLYMTGRDPVPEMQATPKEIQHLKDRIYNPPVDDVASGVLIDKLDTFSVPRRRLYEKELVKRFKAGETDIASKALRLVEHKDARTREAAFKILASCGKPVTAKALPSAIEHLNDPSEIARNAAIRLVRTFAAVPRTEAEKKMRRPPPQKLNINEVFKPLAKASLRQYKDDTTDHVNTPYELSVLLLATNNSFANAPFSQGQEPETVRRILERFLTMDPRDRVMSGPSKKWGRETCIKLSGPVMYVAANHPKNGMFGGGAPKGGQSLLMRHKFVEGLEACLEDTVKVSRIRRGWRKKCNASKLGWFSPRAIMRNKGIGKDILPYMKEILTERPNLAQGYSVGKTTMSYPLLKAIRSIENHKTPEGWTSLREAAMQAFWKEVDAKGDKNAQIAFCRSVLEPERKTYFRQMAALDRLTELLGDGATADMAPYLGHEEWRFQDHSRSIVLKLKGDQVAGTLVRLADNKDERTASSALIMLGARGDKEGVDIGLKHLTSHKSGLVRGSAAAAIYGGSNGKALDKLLAAIKNAHDPEELEEYEKGLLLGRHDKSKAKALGEGIRKAVPECSTQVRRSLYYVLGQLGGETNLAFLKEAVKTKDNVEFSDAVEAISWSPDIPATRVLLDILNEHKGTYRAMVVSNLSVKRLVNGGKDIANVPDDVNLDFAEEHLKVVRNLAILTYLGNIYRGRTMRILYKYMRLGPAKVTSTCAQSIAKVSDGISPDLPLEDRREAALIITQLLEYAKVVYMSRGPLGEGLSGRAKTYYIGNYIKWKSISDSAGKNLSRIYSPEEEDIPDIDPDDVDI